MQNDIVHIEGDIRHIEKDVEIIKASDILQEASGKSLHKRMDELKKELSSSVNLIASGLSELNGIVGKLVMSGDASKIAFNEHTLEEMDRIKDFKNVIIGIGAILMGFCTWLVLENKAMTVALENHTVMQGQTTKVLDKLVDKLDTQDNINRELFVLIQEVKGSK
jgi:hypothetical protein